MDIMFRQPQPWPMAKPSKPTIRLRYLRLWREYRGLTQEELAERVGMTQGMISHLERGISDFTGRHVTLLAEALGCSERDLMFRRPGEDDEALSLLEDLPDREKRQAVEILKTLRRTAQ